MTTAIVTGSSRGIGRAIALELAGMGMDVVVHYARTESAAREVVAAVEAKGAGAALVRGDVADPRTAARLAARAVETFGGIDVLVNNAGEYPRQRADAISAAEWRRTIEVNLSSAFHVSKACIPHLRKAAWGRIVNVSSVLARTGSTQGAHYAAAKAGILGLTRSLARELGPDGVTVNAVCPGMVLTDIMLVYTEEERARRAEQVPMRRIGSPEDVAKAVAYLVTEAPYVTGAALDVNGGLFMG